LSSFFLRDETDVSARRARPQDAGNHRSEYHQERPDSGRGTEGRKEATPRASSKKSAGSATTASGLLPRSRQAASQPPKSPRSAALELVGSRLAAEQATRAAEKIVFLKPFVEGKQVVSLETIWTFFDLPVQPGGKNFEPDDKVIQGLKSKLNRQRLLLHPDKNGHPEAEKTFKFLEQNYQRLMQCAVRKVGARASESVQQRTRREEEELRVEEQRRQRQEEERQAAAAKLQRDEDERHEREIWEAQEKERKAREHKERLEVMIKDKEARNAALGDRLVAAVSTPKPSLLVPSLGVSMGYTSSQQKLGSVSSTLPPMAPAVSVEASSPMMRSASSAGTPAAAADASPSEQRAVGRLTVKLLGAKDLPYQLPPFATNAYGVLAVGRQRFSTAALAGCHPEWRSSFTFDIFRVDTAMWIGVYRSGLGWGLLPDELVGTTEIPFLDLEEWSGVGCDIGRMLEPQVPQPAASDLCMFLELNCSIEWF